MGMNKELHRTEPSAEVMQKVQAREAIRGQRQRYLKCLYCHHNTIMVYEDARGHIEAKCKKCGKITVFDVVSMRKIKTYPSR